VGEPPAAAARDGGGAARGEKIWQPFGVQMKPRRT
jgi:hypothetical protein